MRVTYIMKSRIRDLMGDMSAQEFADKINVERRAVGRWIKQGECRISGDSIKNICDHCGVDYGYLTGQYDEKQYSLHEISTMTGLSEKAITKMISWNNTSDRRTKWAAHLSKMIEDNLFDKMMGHVSEVVGLLKILIRSKDEDNDGVKEDIDAQLWYMSRCVADIVEKMGKKDAKDDEKKAHSGKDSGKTAKNKPLASL